MLSATSLTRGYGDARIHMSGTALIPRKRNVEEITGFSIENIG